MQNQTVTPLTKYEDSLHMQITDYAPQLLYPKSSDDASSEICTFKTNELRLRYAKSSDGTFSGTLTFEAHTPKLLYAK